MIITLEEYYFTCKPIKIIDFSTEEFELSHQAKIITKHLTIKIFIAKM